MSHSSTASHFVAGREPYRGKWRIYDKTLSRAAADDYATELVEAGWRDVMVADLAEIRERHRSPTPPQPVERAERREDVQRRPQRFNVGLRGAS